MDLFINLLIRLAIISLVTFICIVAAYYCLLGSHFLLGKLGRWRRTRLAIRGKRKEKSYRWDV